MDRTENPRSTSPRRRRRPQKGRIPVGLGPVCDILLVVVVVGSALAIGTVHIPALLTISALALLGASIELRSLRQLPWPAVVLAALGLFSALQALPLPASWVSAISASTSAVWLRCILPFGDPPLRHFSLSLDPSASMAEALKWTTYAAVYVMSTRTRVRRGASWLAVLLFGSVTLVSLITLVHGMAELSELYGLYQPKFTPGRWNVGPLLNSNNFAGYAILGLFSAGGLFLSGRSPVPRLALMIGVGVISAALFLSGSRGGVASVLIAGIVALIWFVRAQKSRISLRGIGLALAPLALGIVIAFALGSEHEAGQLTAIDFQRKVSVWLWSLPMIREHLLFGVGRGAFETAFPPYRGALDYDWTIVVSHAENFVVQWIAEWGIPLGIAAVVLIFGYVLREWYRASSDRLRFMVLTGLVALFFQNIADLGLEIPAVAIAAVLTLAIGERSAKTANEVSTEAAKPVGRIAYATVVPALALWGAALAWSRFPVELERNELSAAYRELTAANAVELAIGSVDNQAMADAKELALAGGDELVKGEADAATSSGVDQLTQFRVRLRQAILRHPGEAFFPLLGALVAERTRDGAELKWLAHALELAPTNGPVHLVLADLMHSHGATAQAMLHLRLAAQYDRTLGDAVSVRAPAWAPSVDALMQAIPDGPYGLNVLLAACAKERQVEPKLECFRRAAARGSRVPRAQLAFAQSLLAAIQAEQPPCKDTAVERCIADAESAIRAARKVEPESWRSSYLLAKVLRARGDVAGAARLLTRTCPTNFEGDECWHDALAMAMKAAAVDAIAAAANALASRQCDGAESCADMYTSLASKLEAGGQLALASKFFIKAAETNPSAARWIKVAELAAEAHLSGVARAALDRANRSFDASPSTRAHVELLRQRVARTTTGNPL